MSPSGLSWLQGCLFFLLGVAATHVLNRCQNRRTNHGSSDGGLITILVHNGNTPTPFDDAQSSGSDEEAGNTPTPFDDAQSSGSDEEAGNTPTPFDDAQSSGSDEEAGNTPTPFDDAQSSKSDEEARPPSNLSNPFGEAIASTWSLSCPDRNRLQSESLGHDPRSVSECLGATGQTSHVLESVAQTEAPNFARRDSADMSPSPMSSTTAGLLQFSDEALSPSHPAGETMALLQTPSCPDRKQYRFNTCRTQARNYFLLNEPQDYYPNDYPSSNHQQISVNIRLSRGGVIVNHLIIRLQREGLSCEVRDSIITVSGYPADDGAAGILALVRKFDRGALIVD